MEQEPQRQVPVQTSGLDALTGVDTLVQHSGQIFYHVKPVVAQSLPETVLHGICASTTLKKAPRGSCLNAKNTSLY